MQPLSEEKRSRLALGLVLCAILAYFILFTVVTVGRHRAMETHTLDLVNMDQAVWNTINGRLLKMSPVPGIDTRLARHFEPILLPISLLYLMYNSAETLLIVQTAMIALGGLPVYWLARDRFRNEWMGVLFTGLYLLYPSVQGVNNFDFHPVALSITFLLFTFHAVETNRRWRAILFAILAMGGKENVPLVIMMLGIFILLLRKDKKLGLFFIGIGVVWFIVAFQVIIPYFVPSGFSAYAGRYAHWGETQREIVVSLVTHPLDVLQYLTQPLKLQYYWDLLFPFAFFSLLAPQLLLVSGPIFAINLLSSVTGQSIADKNHYVSAIIPSVVVAAIYGSSWLTRILGKYTKLNRHGLLALVALLLTAVTLYQHYYRGYSPLAYTFSWPWPDDHDAVGQALMAQIPGDASVSAQSDIGPHLSHRQELFLFPRPHEAEYVILDVTSSLFPVRYYEDYVTAVTDTLNSGYGIIASRDGYILMQRGETNSQLSPAFYDFAIPDQNVQPQIPINAIVNQELQLLGYDFQQQRDTTFRVVSYWQVNEPIIKPYQINLHVTTQGMQTIIFRAARTTYWFPPTKWPLNTIVAVDFGPVGLRGATFEQIALSLSVVSEEDEDNQSFELFSSIMAPPLIDNGKSIILGRYCYDRSVLRPCHQLRQFELPPDVQKTAFNFDNKIVLAGFDLEDKSIRPEEGLDFTFYWQSLAALETDYVIFTHLTEREPWLIHGQDDQMPREGAYPTSLWLPDEIVSDEYRISVSSEISPGQYVLRFGVLDPETGERLPVVDEEGNSIGDHAVLTDIRVAEPD